MESILLLYAGLGAAGNALKSREGKFGPGRAVWVPFACLRFMPVHPQRAAG